MRLGAYAKQMGVSYKTAFRWWKAGKLDAYQLDTGTVNESRPKFLKLLTDARIGVIVVEQRDRATRFGLTYIEQLMQMQGRRLEVIFPSDTDHDLLDDFIAVITSMASRISGRRTSKRRAEQIKQCVEHAMKAEDEA